MTLTYKQICNMNTKSADGGTEEIDGSLFEGIRLLGMCGTSGSERLFDDITGDEM